MDDPDNLVRAFMADYFRWNASAMERQRLAGNSGEKREAAIEASEQEWSKILAKYCPPGFVGEPISYGTVPMHDPNAEVILSSTTSDSHCLIHTRMAQKTAGVETVQEYEYRLTREANRWYLQSVLCMVDGEGYDSL